MRYFTVVSKPGYQGSNRKEEWDKYFLRKGGSPFSIRLRVGSDPLGRAVRALEKNAESESLLDRPSLKIVHPKSSNLSTVCLWKQTGAAATYYYVQHKEDILRFDQLESGNVLYLPDLKGKQSVDFYNTVDNVTYRYEAISPADIGLPDSLASKWSCLAGTLFKQVASGGEAEQVIDIRSVQDEYPDENNAVGWLNPLILTFDLEGDDIQHIESHTSSDYLRALSLFLDESSLILIEPHINKHHDVRVGFLIELSQAIQARNQDEAPAQTLNFIEYIFAGSRYAPPWKPFLTLDLLNGEFRAFQNTAEEPIIYWQHPEGSSSNQRWLAKCWLRRWGIAQETNSSDVVDIVRPPSSARPYRPTKGLATFLIDNAPIDKFSQSNLSALLFALQNHPKYVSNRETFNLYRFFVELYQNFVEIGQTLEKFPFINFLHVESQGARLVKFDDVDFWNYFSRNHVIPKSRLLFAVPGQPGKFLDPIRSINFGAYRFLRALFAYFDSRRDRPLVELYNDFGWWNDWHPTIFSDRWNISIRFVEKGGFMLRRSLLGGEDCLGLQANKTNAAYPNMQFSYPLENTLS